jgi:hypothetical protein
LSFPYLIIGSPDHPITRFPDPSVTHPITRSPDLPIDSSLAQVCRFSSSNPAPVTLEISTRGMLRAPQNSRSAVSRSPEPAASIREATTNIGLQATTGLKLLNSSMITR